MNDDSAIGLLWIAYTFGPLLIVWGAIKYTSRNRPNKRTGLPKPSPAATRYMKPGSL